eukprot:6098782-Pyramimonas_sp.AAC.1
MRPEVLRLATYCLCAAACKGAPGRARSGRGGAAAASAQAASAFLFYGNRQARRQPARVGHQASREGDH